MNSIDYLIVGHICSDLTPEGTKVGGTVAYAGRTALALGYKTAALTSAPHNYDWDRSLPGIKVQSIPSTQTTTFENIYSENGRRQKIYHVAEKLHEHHLLKDWQHSRIVHLGPVADEVDPEIIHHFSDSLIGLTPQGWMRQWDETGHVQAQKWPLASSIFPIADAVILSEDDLIDDNLLIEFRKWTRLLVLTQGIDGCTVFFENEVKQMPTIPVRDADPTGAGDIFAAAFFIRLDQSDGNPWKAAEFANRIATETVKNQNLDDKVKIIERIVEESRQN